MLQANLQAPIPYSDEPAGLTFEQEYALADSYEERQRLLAERLGEVDFDRDIDEI